VRGARSRLPQSCARKGGRPPGVSSLAFRIVRGPVRAPILSEQPCRSGHPRWGGEVALPHTVHPRPASPLGDPSCVRRRVVSPARGERSIPPTDSPWRGAHASQRPVPGRVRAMSTLCHSLPPRQCYRREVMCLGITCPHVEAEPAVWSRTSAITLEGAHL